jgi:hypothetical protein
MISCEIPWPWRECWQMLLHTFLSHLTEGVSFMIPRHVGGEIYHMKVKILYVHVLFIFIEKRKLI